MSLIIPILPMSATSLSHCSRMQTGPCGKLCGTASCVDQKAGCHCLAAILQSSVPACRAAEPLNQPISSAELESPLPLLNNNTSGAGEGWPAELLLCFTWRSMGGMARFSRSMFWQARLRPFWRLQFSMTSFQGRSSLVTHIFKEEIGGRCDPANYQQLQWVSLSADLADCMLTSTIAASSADLRKLACRLLARQASAPACPRSTDSLLNATSSSAPNSRSILYLNLLPSWTSEKAFDSLQHPLLWEFLQQKRIHGNVLAAIESLL